MNDEPADSDLRKRAAWLLAMLALVAGLLVVVFIAVLGSGGSGSKNLTGPDDTLGPTTGARTTGQAHSSSTPTSSTPSTSSTQAAQKSCPTSAACALDGDIGNAVAAINAYRTQNDQKAVPGSVSRAAQKCALGNGSGCTGGWAESQVSKPTGADAVAKVSKLGKLLDPSLKSFEIGWAYDPQSKQYFFAVIRND